MLLNSPAVNEYKVLKKDVLVGKIQLKQSLDRKHVCAAREHPHPIPSAQTCMG